MTESIEYFFFLAIRWCARRLSARQVSALGAQLGNAVFTLTRFRKAVTFDNLARAFPGKRDDEIRLIAAGAYKNYGRSILEMLWAGGQSEEDLLKTVRLGNRDVVEKYLRQPGGLILLSAHFGSWEFLVHGLRLQLGRPFTMIAQQQRNGKINALVAETRCRHGNTAIPMGVASREVFKRLLDGDIVLILGDQSASKASIYVDFFGRPAATHRGPAAFSLKTGAPLVMVLLMRQSDGSSEAVFEEVDRTGLDTYTEENIIELTRRHTAILERYIRLHPDHWLWMHKRWKHTAYYESHLTAEQNA
jgi:KDO2-lipid IV(A) lauroyltransferase